MQVSDDQEDELLSIVPIKGETKAVVGSTTGILTIWDRAKGWGDCKLRLLRQKCGFTDPSQASIGSLATQIL